ncbi:MAG: right-handed parallel beta-helix repeat-containing protein, partial [candidate division Zixibacteria bacterium]|nr:right-handed parallel beta-helix repeat-containing protein [candidate division Zixibacteria bacterium]
MRKIGLAFLSILACLAAGVGATNYYVSPSGSDAYTGLSPAAAWRSIERGDALGITHPGDTINILPGTYTRSTTITFNVSGSTEAPIVYRRLGKSPAIVNLGWAGKPAVDIAGSNIVFQGMTITNANEDGIRVEGHYCTVTECYIHDVGKDGINIWGDNTRLIRNIIYSVDDHGIKNEDYASQTKVYGNTIYFNSGSGFKGNTWSWSARIFNNIICKNAKGVDANYLVTCGYNNVWSNAGGNYADGCSDSAGGISTQPRFVDAASGRFDLLKTASEINAGLPLDYPYSQTAPEMGAVEKYTVYYVRPDGNDNASGRTVDLAWRTIDNGDSLLLPGDTAKILPGTYGDSVVIAFGGLVDDRIVYVEESDGAQVAVPSAFRPVRLAAGYTAWSGIDVAGGVDANIYVSGERNLIERAGISSSQTYGIAIASGVQNTITRCTFDHGLIADVYLAGDSSDVLNNTFYSTYFGLMAVSTSKYHRITNNVFLGAAGANTGVRATATTQLTYSIISGFATSVQAVPLGIGCRLEDPLLVDPAAGNLRLSSRSPAIDAGTDIGFPYFGDAPDMGAFEAGILTDLTIIPSIDSIRADTSQQFGVAAVDDSGYPANFGHLTWSHSFTDGTIDSAGLFLPGSVGTGSIHIVSDIDGITDSTASIMIVPGRLATLTVTPHTDTVSADSSLQFSASGFDVRGNEVTDLGRLTWSATNGIGTFDSTGLFSAVRAGKGLVEVVSDYGVTGISDTITVIPGAMTHIDVLPSENIVQQLSSYQYAAFGYDSDSNLVGDYTNSATWTTTDTTGSITSGGLFTAGYVSGDYYIKGSVGGLSDSGAVSVTIGTGLEHIHVERLDGTLFNDTILTTDNDNTRLYARGYTVDGALIGDVVVAWSVGGSDSIGVVDPASGTWCQLALQRPGTGIIVATAPYGRVDSTGTITCHPGIANQLIITPPADTVSADDTTRFSCQSIDADGNLTNPVLIPTWAVRGNIGDITSGGLFTPSNVGSGKVICSAASLADTADPVVVTAGALFRISVHPDSAVIAADSALAFSAVGYDQNDNICSPGGLLWSIIDSIGTIDAAGIFRPTALGVTRVVAVSDLGPIDTSAYLQVTPGRLVELIISPDSVEVTADDRIVFSAVGIDYMGNPATVGNLA